MSRARASPAKAIPKRPITNPMWKTMMKWMSQVVIPRLQTVRKQLLKFLPGKS
jgi:hypothetical protein